MIALLLWGCSDRCPPGDIPALEIGTGEDSFVAVPVGGDVDETFGGQGGFHYWVALRGTQLEPKDAQVQLLVFYEDEEIYRVDYIDQDFKCDRDAGVTELTELRIQPERPYDSADEMLAPLTAIYWSLCECGSGIIAEGIRSICSSLSW